MPTISGAPAGAPPAARGAPNPTPATPARATRAHTTTATQPPPGAKPAHPGPAPATAVQTGGTVTIPIAADPTMNPWHPNAFVESIFVNRGLFDSLTKPGKDLTPAPDLSVSWESAADGFSWTFKLQDNVNRTDGQAFTANDVVVT